MVLSLPRCGQFVTKMAARQALRCAKRDYGPGQHGQRRKGKPTDFGVQLVAKQKMKGYYGNIGEKQFRKYCEEAVRRRVRPEAFAGRIELHLSRRKPYDINPAVRRRTASMPAPARPCSRPSPMRITRFRMRVVAASDGARLEPWNGRTAHVPRRDRRACLQHRSRWLCCKPLARVHEWARRVRAAVRPLCARAVR